MASLYRVPVPHHNQPGDRSLCDIFETATDAYRENFHSYNDNLKNIKPEIEELERQKMMEQLSKESMDLNKMVNKAKNRVHHDTTDSSNKRRSEECEALTEQARKVLKMCESIKGSKEVCKG